METPEQRAERIFKEDAEIQAKRREQEDEKYLDDCLESRKKTYETHKEFIENLYQADNKKQKGKRIRQRLTYWLKSLSQHRFNDEIKQYEAIGKNYRVLFVGCDDPKLFNANERKILEQIAEGYGAFDF